MWALFLRWGLEVGGLSSPSCLCQGGLVCLILGPIERPVWLSRKAVFCSPNQPLAAPAVTCWPPPAAPLSYFLVGSEAGVGGSGPHHPGSTWKVTEEKGWFPDVGMIPGCWDDWFCDIGKKTGTSCQWCEHQHPLNWRKPLRGWREAGTVPPGSCLRARALGPHWARIAVASLPS